MSDRDDVPILLELAPLPREQIGPFLLLGIAKDADQEQIEAHWAQRVIWARKNSGRIPLEDVNWAREVVSDPVRRTRADAASLNLDTADATLRHLAARYGLTRGRPGWQPLELHDASAGAIPTADVPDIATIRAAVALPPIPEESPAAVRLLRQVVEQPLGPWQVDLGPVPQLEPHT